MGQASRYKQNFFANNPFCCFCGGQTPATTIDHVPNRAFFFERNWPVGFEFPACSACQGGPRLSELVCAAIARSWSIESNSVAKETVALWRGLARSDTETFKEILGPERITNLTLPFSTWNRLRTKEGYPLMNLGPRVHEHLDNYIRRITKALYYRHTTIIVPNAAAIMYVLASNADIGSDNEKLIANISLPIAPDLRRSTPLKNATSLTEQFQYTFGVDDQTGDAIFRVRLHQTFVFASAVMMAGQPQNDHSSE